MWPAGILSVLAGTARTAKHELPASPAGNASTAKHGLQESSSSPQALQALRNVAWRRHLCPRRHGKTWVAGILFATGTAGTVKRGL